MPTATLSSSNLSFEDLFITTEIVSRDVRITAECRILFATFVDRL